MQTACNRHIRDVLDLQDDRLREYHENKMLANKRRFTVNNEQYGNCCITGLNICQQSSQTTASNTCSCSIGLTEPCSSARVISRLFRFCWMIPCNGLRSCHSNFYQARMQMCRIVVSVQLAWSRIHRIRISGYLSGVNKSYCLLSLTIENFINTSI